MDQTSATIDLITPERLTTLLQARGVLKQGEVCDVQVSPFGEHHRSLLAHLQLTYSTDSIGTPPTQFVLKMSTLEKNAKEVQQAQQNKKEVAFYQLCTISDGNGKPFPSCYGAIYIEETGQDLLLLEDLSTTHVSNSRPDISPPFSQCQLVIDSLANLHAYWWDTHTLTLQAEYPTTDRIQALVEADKESTNKFLHYIGDRLSNERQALLQYLLTALPSLLEKRLITQKPLTLIHGCAHFWNVLYPKIENAQDMAYVIDWSQWSIDIGTCDLAHLLALHWYPERRARMEQQLLRHYYERLLAHGVKNYSWEQCWYDYRMAVLRTLWIPIRQWTEGVRPKVWWHHLERIFLACEDLQCVQLIEENTDHA